MVAERLSLKTWSELCESVREQVDSTDTEVDDKSLVAETLRLLNEPLPPTSFPFVILFSYADIPAGTTWDTAFDPLNASCFEPTQAVFRFGVFWQRIAQPKLEHGHHQVAVIEFPNGLPPLLDAIPVDASPHTYDYIGLCNFNDLPSVRRCSSLDRSKP